MSERLELSPPDPEQDLGALFAVFSDPNGWWYDPDGRHRAPAQTKDWLTRAAARFATDKLSYWTVRRRDDRVILGVGGAQRQRTGAWNLNYRIGTAYQGCGYATELSRAAQGSAAIVDARVPLIAWVAEHNTPSRKVAERIGLTNYGPTIDPSDGRLRLAYSDRPVGPFHG